MARPGTPRLFTVLLLLAWAGRAAGIVNGSAVDDARFQRDFPWAVALESPGGGSVCTAALISPTWIITAAHCADPGSRVLAGSADRSGAAPLAVAEVVRHPAYDPSSGENDVGLIRLALPLRTAPVRIAAPADGTQRLRPGARAVIAGWGRRSAGSGFSPRLVASDVELASLSFSGSRYAFVDAASGPCGGDSGGPMLLGAAPGPATLVGIASRVAGDPCAQGGGIAIYVSVAAVRAFIESHVTDLPAGR